MTECTLNKLNCFVYMYMSWICLLWDFTDPSFNPFMHGISFYNF